MMRPRGGAGGDASQAPGPTLYSLMIVNKSGGLIYNKVKNRFFPSLPDGFDRIDAISLKPLDLDLDLRGKKKNRSSSRPRPRSTSTIPSAPPLSGTHCTPSRRRCPRWGVAAAARRAEAAAKRAPRARRPRPPPSLPPAAARSSSAPRPLTCTASRP